MLDDEDPDRTRLTRRQTISHGSDEFDKSNTSRTILKKTCSMQTMKNEIHHTHHNPSIEGLKEDQEGKSLKKTSSNVSQKY